MRFAVMTRLMLHLSYFHIALQTIGQGDFKTKKPSHSEMWRTDMGGQGVSLG